MNRDMKLTITIDEAMTPTNHENLFCPYMKKCKWRGDRSIIVDHLIEDHGLKTTDVNLGQQVDYIIDANKNMTKMKGRILRVDNNDILMIICYKKKESSCAICAWCVNVSAEITNNIYRYTIGNGTHEFNASLNYIYNHISNGYSRAPLNIKTKDITNRISCVINSIDTLSTGTVLPLIPNGW